MCTAVSRAEWWSTVPCAWGQEGELLGELFGHVHFGCLTSQPLHCVVAGGGAGGTSRPPPVQAAGHPGHCSNDFVPWPLLLPGRAPGDGPPRPTSVFTASSGTVGDRPLLQCRKPRVREVGSPRSHGQPGDMRVAVRGCGPGLLPSRPNLTGAWGPRGASKGRTTDPASGHTTHFFRPQTLFPFIFFKTAPNA